MKPELTKRRDERAIKRGVTMSKQIFTSKTFWFNLLSGVISVTGAVQGFIPPAAMPVVMAVSAVANIGLRLMTNQPVHV